MFKYLAGAMLVASVPAVAADEMGESQGPVLVEAHYDHQPLRADDIAAAGVMGDHVHNSGEFMLGLRVSRDWYGGDMQQGTKAVSDLHVAHQGYGVGVKSMTMDMVMLDLMWAPTDRLTLMVMPMYMKMDMVMEGLPSVGHGGGHGGHDGHTMKPGMTHGHSVEGFSDTSVSALISVVKSPSFNLHTSLGVSIPTGTVGIKNANGQFTHYMMQLGSGTWDFLPGLTATGKVGNWGWGAQTNYVMRTGKENASGYRLGDKFTGTVWASRQIAEPVSISLRAAYTAEDAISGHYNGPHSHSSPVDLQPNYGGERLDIGVGVNFVVAGGALKGTRLGAEYVHPVWQDLNGIQSPRTNGLQLTIGRTF